MKRGEIRWYKFKTPDKNRPVLILTRNSILEYLGEVTVAPITSTISCVINFDHIQTVSKNKIGSLIAVLSPERLKEASEAILFSLEL